MKSNKNSDLKYKGKQSSISSKTENSILKKSTITQKITYQLVKSLTKSEYAFM